MFIVFPIVLASEIWKNRIPGTASTTFLMAITLQNLFVNASGIWLFLTLRQVRKRVKTETEIFYQDDTSHTTIWREEIYTLCFISCLKGEVMKRICPEIESSEE